MSTADLKSPPSFSDLVDLERHPQKEPTANQRHANCRTTPTSDGAEIATLRDPAERDDAFGLALSGGGIRSATYNLGVLQGLAAHGLLDAFDYLATVSGGGYIGGFLSAARSRKGRTLESILLPADGRATTAAGEGRVEADAVRHLREYGNFLAPRLGLFSYDTGRMVVAAVSAVVPSLAAALSLIGLALAMWFLVAVAITGGAGPGWLGVAVAVGLTGAVLTVAEWRWVARGEENSRWYWAAALIAVLLSAAGWGIARNTAWSAAGALYSSAWPLPLIGNDDPIARWLGLFLPAGIWGAAVLCFVVVRWLMSRFCGALAWRERRAAFDRVTSRLIFMSVVWVVVCAVWIAGVVVWQKLGDGATPSAEGARFTGMAGTTAALALVFRAIQRVLSKTQGAHALGGPVRTWLIPKLPQVAAYATVLGMVITVEWLTLWLASSAPAGASIGGVSMPLIVGATTALGIFVFTLVFFDPNEMGLHAFYRARIARAFLGAGNDSGRRQTEERGDDDVLMSGLSAEKPLHIVCCAANDLSSREHLGNLHRGAASAALSRVGFSVGSDWTAWPDETRAPSLASAVTASGAAFNSHMGSLSMSFGPAVTFVMAALNLRLGLWLPHPTAMARRSLGGLFPGLQFYGEMLGISRVNGSHVHLSDGGHFENMALYELVRRHCRFILASDCGADPDVGFNDFGNLVRRVREDFGVEIDIDLSPLRPDDSGLARQSMVAGDVHYPNGDTGVLLMFKPTLVGSEPADIAQYRRRNSAFPHESTGDQFYDEAQWESYRRLGLHAANVALSAVVERCGSMPARDKAQWAARVFARARMRWLPTPAGIESRLGRHVDRATSLDALLQKSGCRLVLREVYREVDTLEGLVARITSGANGGNGGEEPPIVRPPDTAAPTLGEALHAVRLAILFMEEVFHTENLARNYNHPLYLGLLNYFARWAQAPLLRMWWPVLKALYTERFTTFMEKQFGLSAIPARDPQNPELDAAIVTHLSERREGFAMESWQMRTNRRARADDTVISYQLNVRYGSESLHVQAAVLVARQYTGLDATRRETERALVWDAQDFFVPPGLWGIGIGEDFLDRLVERRAALLRMPGTERIDHLIVRIPARRGGIASRKEGSDLTQMYRAAGFKVLRSVATLWDGGGKDPAGQPLEDIQRSDSCWLIRSLPGDRADETAMGTGASAAESARSGYPFTLPAQGARVSSDRAE